MSRIVKFAEMSSGTTVLLAQLGSRHVKYAALRYVDHALATAAIVIREYAKTVLTRTKFLNVEVAFSGASFVRSAEIRVTVLKCRQKRRVPWGVRGVKWVLQERKDELRSQGNLSRRPQDGLLKSLRHVERKM